MIRPLNVHIDSKTHLFQQEPAAESENEQLNTKLYGIQTLLDFHSIFFDEIYFLRELLQLFGTPPGRKYAALLKGFRVYIKFNLLIFVREEAAA